MGQQSIAIEQLIPGRLEATDSTAAYGSVLMSTISTNLPVLIRATSLFGSSLYVLPEAAHAVYCAGRRCGSEHCVVAGNSSHVELICSAPAEVVICRAGGRQSTLQHGICRLVGSAVEITRLRAMIASLCDPIDELVTPLHAPCVAELRDRLAELSAVSAADESVSASRRAMSMERGRRYIDSNLVGPLRIANVCEAAGVRARTLEYGFRELFGISPVSYIKAQRLNRVRRLLLSPASARRTITAIALDSGFWHLSQFAADYQKFFGESPSITRRRSLAADPAQLQEARWAVGF
jgi:AraC-like DNA-binding protein